MNKNKDTETRKEVQLTRPKFNEQGYAISVDAKSKKKTNKNGLIGAGIVVLGLIVACIIWIPKRHSAQGHAVRL